MPNRRRFPTGAMLLLLALLADACATQSESVHPVLEAWSYALEPVGGVIPVFVKIRCESNCGAQSFPLTRTQVSARNDAGQYVQPLKLEEAVQQVGGAQRLVDALSEADGSAWLPSGAGVTLGNLGSGLKAGGRAAGMGGALLGMGIASLYSGYLAAHPEALAQAKLDYVAIAENRERDHNPTTFHQGWVFFPNGKYTELKLAFAYAPGAFSTEERIETVSIPWFGPPEVGPAPSAIQSAPAKSGAEVEQ